MKKEDKLHLECVIHYGKYSDEYVAIFNRKKVVLLRETLKELNEDELNELYKMLEEKKQKL